MADALIMLRDLPDEEVNRSAGPMWGLMLVENHDVVILGGGAMGTAAAWALARRGCSVVLLEQFTADHKRGASHGSSRIFRAGYPVPDYTALAVRAYQLWRDLEKSSGEVLLASTGAIDHGEPSELEQIQRVCSTFGVRHELLRPEAAAERWPGMRFTGPVLVQPTGGRIASERALAVLRTTARAHGADLRYEVGACSLRTRGGGVTVVPTSGAAVRGKVAVVAAGAWSSQVLAGLVALPALHVTQEQVLYYRARSEALTWPSFIHRRDPSVYGLFTPGRGVKVAEHHTGVSTHPDTRDYRIEPGRERRLRRYVQDWLPGLDEAPVDAETCLYTSTDTEDHILDRVGDVVVAAGFSGHGFKFTPVYGELLADLALGCSPSPERLRLAAAAAGAKRRPGHL